jgi:hypothetical protein
MNDQDQNQINNTDGNGTPSQKSDRPKARHPLILTGTSGAFLFVTSGLNNGPKAQSDCVLCPVTRYHRLDQ